MVPRSVVALATGTLLLSALPAQAADVPHLNWIPCGAQQECAWLTVPIDHAAPERGTIDLRLLRVPAVGPSPLGTLVVNPGGPGASGVAFVRASASAFPAALRESFTIVGFDTRGSGDSSPLRCVTPTFHDRYVRMDPIPTTPEAERAWLDAGRVWSRGCRTDQPLLARHMRTADIVQDMEVLRAALDDPRLNFLGFSYGTLLAARYAENYPDRVGRFVLDGAVDPRRDAMQISRGQSIGFQRALQRSIRACTKRATCALGDSARIATKNLNALLDRIERTPLPTRNGRGLVESEALTGIITALYARASWPTLWRALAAAQRGDGTELQRLADIGNGRADNFTRSFYGPFLATTCSDLPRPPGRIGLRDAARAWSRTAEVPRLAALLAWSNAPCSEWFMAGDRPSVARSTTSAALLIIGTRHDPATPYDWSVALHRQLNTSHLLTVDGDGHTAFGSGSTCVDAAVTAYLLDGALTTSRC